MATMAELAGGVKQGFLPAIRGVGTGASMGLHKYPAAGIMKALDYLMGEGKMTYAEALEAINAQQQEDRDENPVASYGGQIVGSLSPAGAARSAGIGIAKAVPNTIGGLMKSVAGAGAVGAGQGAISGFNENQDLTEAGLGAGLGAILGGAGQAISGLGSKVLRGITRKTAAEHQDLAGAAIRARKKELKEIMKDVAARGKRAKPSEREAKKIANIVKSIKGLDKGLIGAEEVSRKAVLKSLKDEDFVGDTASKYLLGAARGNLSGRRAELAGSSAGDVLRPSLLGGALGYGSSFITEADPTMSALGGAGVFGGTQKFHKGALQSLAGLGAKIPMNLPRNVTSGALQGVAPVTSQLIAPRIDARVSPGQSNTTEIDDLDALFDQYASEAPKKKSSKTEVDSEDLDALFDSYQK